jgi:hypothetical protein
MFEESPMAPLANGIDNLMKEEAAGSGVMAASAGAAIEAAAIEFKTDARKLIAARRRNTP